MKHSRIEAVFGSAYITIYKADTDPRQQRAPFGSGSSGDKIKREKIMDKVPVENPVGQPRLVGVCVCVWVYVCVCVCVCVCVGI